MEKKYKETLNLPQTRFPMKANLPQREPEMLKFWEEADVYGKLRELGKDRPSFILHDGPPYANGHLHIGHGVNKILKDIIVKFKTLQGYDAPYVPGWDCHGLPIELNVEKKKGKPGVKISPDEFRQACRDYALSQVDIQREEFKRMGVMGEWDNPYLTMDPHIEACILRALGDIIKNGHLARGEKPVLWCLDCQSSLAEAEVEYKDKQSPSVDVRFEAVDKTAFLKVFEQLDTALLDTELPLSVPIWTTTPWTLPANQAVALNGELLYSLIKTDTLGFNWHDELLVVASDMLESIMQRYGPNSVTVLHEVRGDKLKGLMLHHPFCDREVPIVLGDHVTTESGTGCVHTAPAHGIEDYAMALQFGIPTDSPVRGNGVYSENAEVFANEHIFKVNDKIIQLLREKYKLLHEEKIEHSYPHCWRHKTPVIYRATPQWFISMDQNGLREKALEQIKQCEWIPDWGQARITDMIEKRPDWCISRQRYWGTPLPLFFHKETGELHPDTVELIDKVADLVEKDSIDAWFALDPKTLLGDEAENYEKSPHTLDVWFDSGVTHTTVLREREHHDVPADMYLEGSDQHRGWFHSSLLTSIAMYGKAPYKTVLTHGFTVDEKGFKMSKSIGNIVPSDTMIKANGADILRLWVASTDYRAEIAYSDEIRKRINDTYRRLRNTARFLLSNLHDFKPEEHLQYGGQLWPLDRWALEMLFDYHREISECYNSYQFHIVTQKLHHFCNIELGSFYLDVLKDRLYTLPADHVGRRSAQIVLFAMVNALAGWAAPILSFTAEEIWQCLRDFDDRPESVFLAPWDAFDVKDSAEHEKGMKAWHMIHSVRDEVNKELERLRGEEKIGAPLDAVVTLYCDKDANSELFELLTGINSLEKNEPNEGLRFVFITSEVHVLPAAQKPDNAIKTGLDGLWLQVMPSEQEKCIRCWHRRADVGENKEHPELCGRCVVNVG